MDNKKLLVFSDSHGNSRALKAVFNWAKDHLPPNDTICAAAFLGDGISDLQYAADESGFYTDWKLVMGNNDYGIVISEALTFNFAEHNFFMCHGHRLNLYNDFNILIAAANNVGADVALFGHIHIPYYKIVNGITLINPGSVGRPRSKIGATFAVIECPTGKPLNVKFYEIGTQGKIKEVKI
ncbi:phosphodiesterase [Treponema sp. R8-4-B8]